MGPEKVNKNMSESSDSEEDVEPKLKYLRLSNDLKRILNQDAISTVKVHSKVSQWTLKTDWFEMFTDISSTCALEPTWAEPTCLITWETSWRIVEMHFHSTWCL